MDRSGWPTGEGQKQQSWLLLTQKRGRFGHAVLPKGHKGGLTSRNWILDAVQSEERLQNWVLSNSLANV